MSVDFVDPGTHDRGELPDGERNVETSRGVNGGVTRAASTLVTAAAPAAIAPGSPSGPRRGWRVTGPLIRLWGTATVVARVLRTDSRFRLRVLDHRFQLCVLDHRFRLCVLDHRFPVVRTGPPVPVARTEPPVPVERTGPPVPARHATGGWGWVKMEHRSALVLAPGCTRWTRCTRRTAAGAARTASGRRGEATWVLRCHYHRHAGRQPCARVPGDQWRWKSTARPVRPGRDWNGEWGCSDLSSLVACPANPGPPPHHPSH